MGPVCATHRLNVHAHKIIQYKKFIKNHQKMAAITLAYWDIRGLANPIRMLLEYSGANYTDKRYNCGDAPGFDLSDWTNVKFKLGLDFPNLPYLIDGNIKVTQSNAILRYLGRKFGLDGKTEADKVRVDMMCDNAMDFRNGFVGLSYNPDFDNLKPGEVIKFANLVGFIKRMEALPKIGAFLKSGPGQVPMNNKMAKFGAKL